MAENELIIRVTGKGKYIPVASFVAVVQNTLTILREVDAELSEQRLGSLTWRISNVSLNSPLEMTIFAEPNADLDVSRDVVEVITTGLRQIDSSPDSIPAFFTPRALEGAKRLVSVLNDGIERIALRSPQGELVTPTQRVAANVDELIQDYEELTTFEGPLEAVTLRGKRIFYIWDPIDGRISCRFPEDMLDEVRTLLGHRASVYGRARFSSTGKPLFIQVEEVERLPSQEELPKVKNLKPINITNGLDSVEYVRRQRDGE
jgi:hypothetical protein